MRINAFELWNMLNRFSIRQVRNYICDAFLFDLSFRNSVELVTLQDKLYVNRIQYFTQKIHDYMYILCNGLVSLRNNDY